MGNGYWLLGLEVVRCSLVTITCKHRIFKSCFYIYLIVFSIMFLMFILNYFRKSSYVAFFFFLLSSIIVLVSISLVFKHLVKFLKPRHAFSKCFFISIVLIIPICFSMYKWYKNLNCILSFWMIVEQKFSDWLSYSSRCA